ncbi:MAG: hypothetical protein O6940_08075 [Ignavibacteria bacterium]|nr:hypothetical protein [Ignavibacteria bacterium]
MKTDKSRYKLLILLVLTDFFFIVFHILHTYTDFASSRLLSIERDFGFAEMFQYIKAYWIGLMLLWLALKRRSFLFFGWSQLFIYLLFDDALQIHEKGGNILARDFNLQPILGLRAQDIGELGIVLIVGVAFLAIIGISHYFSEQRLREISKRIAILLVALVFFGVFIDMIHSMFSHTRVNYLLVLIEDGGEMVVMSLITWYVFKIDQESIAGDEIK